MVWDELLAAVPWDRPRYDWIVQVKAAFYNLQTGLNYETQKALAERTKRLTLTIIWNLTTCQMRGRGDWIS